MLLLQSAIELDGKILVNMAPDTSRDIRKSTWSSRAWTYQEGFLSRRRLIFTDHQVVFSCNGECYEEEIYDPRPYINPGPMAGSDFLTDLFPSARMSHNPLYYCTEVSRRNISYDLDLLNALSGMLNFVRERHGSVHICGVPAAVGSRRGDVTISLAWCHDVMTARRYYYPS